jgi:hypothetical protein
MDEYPPIFDEKGHRGPQPKPFLAPALAAAGVSREAQEVASFVEGYRGRAWAANISWEPILAEATKRSRETPQSIRHWLPIVWDEYLAKEWTPPDHLDWFVPSPIVILGEERLALEVRPRRSWYARLAFWVRRLPQRYRWWREGS